MCRNKFDEKQLLDFRSNYFDCSVKKLFINIYISHILFPIFSQLTYSSTIDPFIKMTA